MALPGMFPQIKPGEVYADWTGSAIPPIHLIDQHHKYLGENLIGNPHSHHRPSAEAMERVMSTRAAILRYLHASPEEYEVIFGPGATAAIQLVGQHYKWEGGEYLLTADNHNSVNGVREMAKRNGAVVRYAPITDDLVIDGNMLRRMLRFPRSTGNKLFAYPAKSNYSGVLHSLEWVGLAQSLGWEVLLDAAAFNANKRLDLSVVKPDFVPFSFYKMFGFPTGLGCLVIRKSAFAKLAHKWFAGGSILLVAVMQDFYAPESLGYARFEHGTINFGQIPAIQTGLQFMEDLGDGVGGHAVDLATALYDELVNMKENSCSLLVHSPRGTDTVTFSMKSGDQIVDAWVFEQEASKRGVFVRSGCFCNPGVNEKVFGYGIEAYANLYNDAILPEAITIEKLREFSDGKPIGAIRASFGYANTVADVVRFASVTRDILRAEK
ncbi:MAG: aminotransferase class V-fold PLP-dependent enzyme [Candidatus Komeilibacteria bacterium]